MPTLLAISPHLDDAVFSAGGTLSQYAREGWDVVVTTCFTGNVAQPQGFALKCQLDKDIPANIDYMALRRVEDSEACSILGATAIHLPLLEAPHRGYNDAAALFGSQLPHDTVATALYPELVDLVEHLRPDIVLAPAAVGNHVDHWVVRDTLAIIIAARVLDIATVKLWTDWPYANRTAVQSLTLLETRPITTIDLDAKISASSAYTTQLKFQFGSQKEMELGMMKQTSEIFWSMDVHQH